MSGIFFKLSGEGERERERRKDADLPVPNICKSLLGIKKKKEWGRGGQMFLLLL